MDKKYIALEIKFYYLLGKKKLSCDITEICSANVNIDQLTSFGKNKVALFKSVLPPEIRVEMKIKY